MDEQVVDVVGAMFSGNRIGETLAGHEPPGDAFFTAKDAHGANAEIVSGALNRSLFQALHLGSVPDHARQLWSGLKKLGKKIASVLYWEQRFGLAVMAQELIGGQGSGPSQ